jgi:transposase
MLYSVCSERLLIEEIDCNILFRWFVGLNLDDAVWDATVFTKKRDRLLDYRGEKRSNETHESKPELAEGSK